MSKKRPSFPSELDPTRRLMFLALAQSDMTLAMETVDLALKHTEQTSEYLAYCEAAIIRYTRPFCASRVVAATPNKRINVALGDGYIPTNTGAAELHAHVMSMRSSIIAHSDMRNRNVVLRRNPEPGPSTKWFATVMHRSLLPGHLSNLRHMARSISMRLHQEIDDAAQSQFGNTPMGADIQIGGGDPEYIQALQKGWNERHKM